MDIDFRTWNVFRRRNDGGLCCAVPAETPLPPFLLSGEWDFGFAIADGGRPVSGFCPSAAETGADLSGFHLFLAFVPPPGTAPGDAESRFDHGSGPASRLDRPDLSSRPLREGSAAGLPFSDHALPGSPPSARVRRREASGSRTT